MVENYNKILLTEGLTSEVYHFTTSSRLINILKENRMYPSKGGGSDDFDYQKLRKGYGEYFISFSRNKSTKDGYAAYSGKDLDVRITFNGDELNNNHYSVQFNFFRGGDSSTKKSEFEDRLYLREKPPIDGKKQEVYLDNVTKYITRIDVYLKKNNDGYVNEIVDLCKQYEIPLYIYDNNRDFSWGNNNNIEYESSSSMNGKFYNALKTKSKDIFIDKFIGGVARVEMDNKWNLLKRDGQLLSNQWFDDIWDFVNGFATVKLDDKYNLITTTGEVLSPNQWFDYINDFEDGFAQVNLDDKYYNIDNEGNLTLREGAKKKKIIISEKQVVLLKEGLTSEVYHFTTTENLVSILKENRIKPSTPQEDRDRYDKQKLRKGYGEYFISVTRNKSDRVGYPESRHLNVRIELNGKELNNNHYSVQFNFFRGNNSINPNDSEFEERIYLREKPPIDGEEQEVYLDNVAQYITRIDIYFKRGEHRYINEIVDLCDKYNIPLYIYKDPRDFTWRTDNNIEYESSSSMKERFYDALKNNSKDVFIDKFIGGVARVEMNNKWNYINKKKQLLIPNQWFNNVGDFYNGVGRVDLDGAFTFINTKGELMYSDQWFELNDFENGFAKVLVKNKWNFINRDGQLLSPNLWFDTIYHFKDDFAKVELDHKYNLLKRSGELFFPGQWFYSLSSFYNGFAKVQNLYDKWNYIDKDGNFLSKKWFVWVSDFRDGIAKVRLNNLEYNFINTNGEILFPNQGFSWVGSFKGGLAQVELSDEKSNFITATGEVLSPNQWFDEVDDFYNGFAEVKLNNKYNFINKNGELVSPNQWFNRVWAFKDGSAQVNVDNRYYDMDGEGNLTLMESHTPNKPRIILSEKQVILLKEHYDNLSNPQKSLLLERSKQDDAFFKYMKDNGKTHDEAMDIRKALQRTFTNARPNGWRFLTGLGRMYLAGELNDEKTNDNLNTALGYITGPYVDKYDFDLNGESSKEIIDKFFDQGKVQMDKDRADFASRYNKYDKSGNITSNKGHNYEVVPINSHEEATKYSPYVDWCITKHEGGCEMHDKYTSGGTGRFYFLLAPGYQDVPKEQGPGYPYDEYGESMIAVNVDRYGNLNTCTLRWNNGDDMFNKDKDQLSEFLSNTDFHTIFEPYNEEEIKAKKEAFDRLVQEALEKYRDGDDSGFDSINSLSYGLIKVGIKNKENLMNKEGELLSPNQWFNKIWYFNDGFATVDLDHKHNYINKNGELVSPNQWFDNVDIAGFKDGFARVYLNNLGNFINKKGEYLSDQWFDDASDFNDGSSVVELKGKKNLMNLQGELLLNEWVDNIYNFSDGFAIVSNKGKGNYIDRQGKFMFPNKWFDITWPFINGLGKVRLNNQMNWANTKGELISPDQWFQWADDFKNGFARVKLGDKYNYINKRGEIISPDQWFDDVWDFYYDFATVKLNGKKYKIDREGNLSLIESHTQNKPLLYEEKSILLKETPGHVSTYHLDENYKKHPLYKNYNNLYKLHVGEEYIK